MISPTRAARAWDRATSGISSAKTLPNLTANNASFALSSTRVRITPKQFRANADETQVRQHPRRTFESEPMEENLDVCTGDKDDGLLKRCDHRILLGTGNKLRAIGSTLARVSATPSVSGRGSCVSPLVSRLKLQLARDSRPRLGEGIN